MNKSNSNNNKHNNDCYNNNNNDDNDKNNKKKTKTIIIAISNINVNRKHLANENKVEEDTSRKSEGFEIINFTINRSNVDYESNAIKQEKIDMVKYQSNNMNSITRLRLNKLELEMN